MFLLKQCVDGVPVESIRPLHSTMFLLKRYTKRSRNVCHVTLHSTMFLLKLPPTSREIHFDLPLHSTMFLLKHENTRERTSGAWTFTFHNVSIKTSGDGIVLWCGALALHSTMFLLKRKAPL